MPPLLGGTWLSFKPIQQELNTVYALILTYKPPVLQRGKGNHLWVTRRVAAARTIQGRRAVSADCLLASAKCYCLLKATENRHSALVSQFQPSPNWVKSPFSST